MEYRPLQLLHQIKEVSIDTTDFFAFEFLLLIYYNYGVPPRYNYGVRYGPVTATQFQLHQRKEVGIDTIETSWLISF
jgi:hypothetical protein